MTKVLLPNAIQINAKELEDGTWEIQYCEEFKDSPELEEARKANPTIMAALRNQGAYNIEQKENSISFHLTDSREEVFGLLAAEFLANSPLGRMCLKDILGSLVLLRQKVADNSTQTPQVSVL